MHTPDTTRHFMDAGFVPSIKCVLIGDYEVGKTSLINAFATREPLNQYFPGLTGPIQIHIEHLFHLYLLHIHDTEGEHAPSLESTPAPSPSPEEARATGLDLSEISINNEDDDEDSNNPSRANKWISRGVEYGLADVILVCFSLANRQSFENVATVWTQEIQRLCPHVPFIIIGCKLDLRRPDPTTPAAIPAQRLHPPSARHSGRRPKPARSSTASTTGSTASPSSSEFNHPAHDSSASITARPPGILTNSIPASTHDHGVPSSAPASDVEFHSGKLKTKTSFSIPFPAAKAFRRKSIADVKPGPPMTSTTSTSTPPSSYSSPAAPRTASGNIEATKHNDAVEAAAGRDDPQPSSSPNSPRRAQPASTSNSPKSPRHAALPPMLRSLSQAAVFRKVLSRSSIRTQPSTKIDPSSLPSPNDTLKPSDDENTIRPTLPHRLTSGSAGETSVRNLHSHVRTSSQPTPAGLTDLVENQLQQPAASTAEAQAPSTSPARKMTRIEEPPIVQRHRTITYQEARGVARQLGASGYMECSALTLVNVVKVFDEAVRIAVERRTAPASSLHGRGRRGGKNDDCVVC